jgi:hypothetical protein
MKALRLWLFATTVGFYTTFVLQNLWNWFVVGALNVGPVSYWQMFGLNMIVAMVAERNTIDEDNRWKRAGLLLFACLPDHKRRETEEEIKNEDEYVWFEAGWTVFSKLLTNTATLGIGWAIHAFIT